MEDTNTLWNIITPEMLKKAVELESMVLCPDCGEKYETTVAHICWGKK